MRLREVALGTAAASLGVWIGLLAFRGGFWRVRVDEHRRDEPSAGGGAATNGRATGYPDVEAVVPARDEAATIGPAISSLVEQRYNGRFSVTLVDDASDDDTARLARAAVADLPHERRLNVVLGDPLLDGWTGKLNALQTGIRAATKRRGAPPEFWLFTDADIVHDRDNVATLIAKARNDDRALVSLMVRLHAQSEWERLLVPAFVFFFAKLYPFAWTRDRARASAAAAGGCLLVSNEALEAMGGLDVVRDALIDDCAIARGVKRAGFGVWLGLSDRTRSIRRYDRLADFWSTIRRTAFTQLGYSYPMLGATVVGMVALYLVPPLALVTGIARRDATLAGLGGLAWGAMAVAYAPTLRAYGQGPERAALLPVAGALYTAMTIDSALAHARKRGGGWKGRTYSLDIART